ncbi:MAG: polyprenyl synthetase family protein [Nitrosomonadales bacterium]
MSNKKFLTDFNKFIKSIVKKGSVVNNASIYALQSGGKRFRPLLIYNVCSYLGIPRNNSIRISAAIECIHSYSLIHDDLPCMDNDSLRRGKPTCHIKYNEAQALLAGDGLQTLAFELLSDQKFKLNDKVKISMINLLSKLIGLEGMVLGQSLDIEYEVKKGSYKVLKNIHMNKTGKLISACFELPLLAVDVTKSVKLKLQLLGKSLGILYQMIDDYMDDQSNLKSLGKKTGKDREKNKTTYLTFLGKDKTKILIKKEYSKIIELTEKLNLNSSFKLLLKEIYSRYEY